jgi:hypothetical protein
MTRSTLITSVILLVSVTAACHAADTDASSDTGAPATPADTESTSANTEPTIAPLPLKRGYYVAGDTACSDASNATVLLVRRDGIAGSRHFCEFRKVEQIGPDTWRVTQACSALYSTDPPEISSVTYTIPNATSFVSRDEYGHEHSARYCDQSSMSAPFRENDISDVTG